MKKSMRSLGIASVALGLALAGSPAAFAGTDARVTTTGAWGYFGAYGEVLSVQDTNGTDNASARAQLLVGGVVKGTVWASGPGDGTKTLNLSIAEGAGYTLKVCRVVKSTGYVYNCATGTGTA